MHCYKSDISLIHEAVGMAQHRGSIRASRPVILGSNLGAPKHCLDIKHLNPPKMEYNTLELLHLKKIMVL